jgi:hypothetical protein
VSKTQLQQLSPNLLTAVKAVDAPYRPAMHKLAIATAEKYERLQKVAEAGNFKKWKREANKFLHSDSVRHSAALLAIYRRKENSGEVDGKGAVHISDEDLDDVFTSMQIRSDCGEKIYVTSAPKPDGGHRVIHKFGPVRSAESLAIAWVIKSNRSLYRHDLSLGGGMNDVAEKVLTLINQGYKHFGVFDVVDFFGSIDGEKAREILPLPKQVTQAVIFPNEKGPLLIDPMSEMTTVQARRGLPQGARASNLVAAVLSGVALEGLDGSPKFPLFRDDGLIAAQDAKEAEVHLDALRSLLKGCPFGPLKLKTAEVRALEEGVSFVGYLYKRLPNGELYVGPSMSGRARMRNKMLAKCLSATVEKIEITAQSYYEHWKKNRKLWTVTEGDLIEFEGLLYETVQTAESALQQNNSLNPADYKWVDGNGWAYLA